MKVNISPKRNRVVTTRNFPFSKFPILQLVLFCNMSEKPAMDNVFVSDPKLTIHALRCDENKSAFGPLLENKQVG
jgi:hypothetical protein